MTSIFVSTQHAATSRWRENSSPTVTWLIEVECYLVNRTILESVINIY